MQNNNNNIPIKEDKKSKLPTTSSNSSARYLVVGSIAAASAFTILALVYAGGTEQVFAPPPPPCPNCATIINGTGEGTITIPENKKAEIRPAPCDNCDATISFEAFEDAKGTGGTITITYVDEEGVTQTIQDNDVSSLKVSGDKFVLRGTAEIGPPSCVECTTVNYVLAGEVTDKETGEATMVFKADSGIKGNFVGDDVTISIIGPG